jgi:hypothetical protein
MVRVCAVAGIVTGLLLRMKDPDRNDFYGLAPLKLSILELNGWRLIDHKAGLKNVKRLRFYFNGLKRRPLESNG